jgi:hypothetical protein
MNTSDVIRTEVVVMPIRFTDHLPRMRSFLSLLGFSPNVTRADKWATMVGDSGMVTLHAADISASSSGDTGLSFEVADADSLADQFTQAGFVDVEIYDEAYGRVLRVPGHPQLTFDERPTDRYGYQVDEPQPEHGIVSMPLLFSPDTGPLDRLLSAAGFVRLDEGDDWQRVWRSTGGGLIAMHPPGDDTPTGSVRLGCRTRESLTDLADRLTAAGYANATASATFGGELTVTDPDGQTVHVRPVSDQPA